MKTGSSIASIMLITMLIMALGFWMYSIAMSLSRVRSIILERERDSQWVRQLPEVQG
jgi:heme exporter protein C